MKLKGTVENWSSTCHGRAKKIPVDIIASSMGGKHPFSLIGLDANTLKSISFNMDFETFRELTAQMVAKLATAEKMAAEFEQTQEA